MPLDQILQGAGAGEREVRPGLGDRRFGGADLLDARAGGHHVRILPRGLPVCLGAHGAGAGGVELLGGDGSLGEQLLQAGEVGAGAIARRLRVGHPGARRGPLLGPGPVAQLVQLRLRRPQRGDSGGHLVARLRLLQRVGGARLRQARVGARHARGGLVHLRLRLLPLQRQVHLGLRRVGAHHRQRRPGGRYLILELRVVEAGQDVACAHGAALIHPHLHELARQLGGNVHLRGIHDPGDGDPIRGRSRQ